jgi:CheY-like chemotaxis protein
MKSKILIVDDSEIVLEMAREALEEGGFAVLTATSPVEANSYIFAAEQPDLIILDVMLPVLDGDKKAKMLKEDERTRHIPILLISSKPEEELRRLVRESRADGFIRKPFTSRYMIDTVKETLRQPTGGQ